MNNLTNETIEFLWYSYFGVSVQKAKTMDKNQLMLICAEKAYLDMNRTLSFKIEERNNFCTDICDLIINKIKEKAFKVEKRRQNPNRMGGPRLD